VQASCPQCGSKVAIDDAKVPDRPFSVKCPKCQNAIKLPGKAPMGIPTPAPTPAPMPPLPGVSATPDTESVAAPAAAMGSAGDEGRASGQGRREAALGRAMVALPDKSLSGQLAGMLGRLGVGVDTLDDWEEGARLLEQGVYHIVATARVAGQPGKGESLYQRINRLNPEARRRIFLILVGDEFKSGDGTQAFAVLADVVVNARDAASAENMVRATLAERQRLYQAFLDARRRHEEAAS
jgi:predicted Zn finger-like uncharacterized protein